MHSEHQEANTRGDKGRLRALHDRYPNLDSQLTLRDALRQPLPRLTREAFKEGEVIAKEAGNSTILDFGIYQIRLLGTEPTAEQAGANLDFQVAGGQVAFELQTELAQIVRDAAARRNDPGRPLSERHTADLLLHAYLSLRRIPTDAAKIPLAVAIGVLSERLRVESQQHLARKEKQMQQYRRRGGHAKANPKKQEERKRQYNQLIVNGSAPKAALRQMAGAEIDAELQNRPIQSAEKAGKNRSEAIRSRIETLRKAVR